MSDPCCSCSRDCVMRRVVPVMEQVYHARINVMEAPLIGCYPSESGGWFHAATRTTPAAPPHRQFALQHQPEQHRRV